MNEIIKYYNSVYEKVDINKLLIDINEGESIQKNCYDINYEINARKFISKIDRDYTELVLLTSAEVKILSLLFGTARNFRNNNIYQAMNSYLTFLYSLKDSKIITGALELTSGKVGV